MNLVNVDGSIRKLIETVEACKDLNIKLSANGGNSILLVCNPKNEIDYINAMDKMLDKEKYVMIDLNQLLCKFVNENKDEIEEEFELMKSSTEQIFHLPTGEEGNDFFEMIITQISEVYKIGKIPVLIDVGALYGTDIGNIHIMENEVVMQGINPLVILYPAIRNKDELLFLGVRPASKYRCMVIYE